MAGDVVAIMETTKKLGRFYNTALANSLFATATKQRQTSCFEFLMRKASSRYGAMVEAAKNGDLETLEVIASILERRMTNDTAKRKTARSFHDALYVAADRRHTNCVTFLLTRTNVGLRTTRALCHAVWAGSLAAVEELLVFNMHDKDELSSNFSDRRWLGSNLEVMRALIPHVTDSAIAQAFESATDWNFKIDVVQALLPHVDDITLSKVLNTPRGASNREVIEAIEAHRSERMLRMLNQELAEAGLVNQPSRKRRRIF